ncbi:MAG: hypothetical protein VR72_06405 [Clostridiaceae bacterium BRH_c20a]|nr:MAG: hypothetical protein VR72_06405 [Clostridiaceae bacterium BRH_c20a]
MDRDDILEKQKLIFGSIFLLSNKLQVIMDRDLARYDLTAKQWFLTAIMEEFFNSPPTLSELAEAMGSTHQNVKQIALKLQKRDLLEMQKDEKDRRATRLKLTEKSYAFWDKRQEQSKSFLNEFFEDLSEEELNIMCYGLNKLYEKLLKLGETQK